MMVLTSRESSESKQNNSAQCFLHEIAWTVAELRPNTRAVFVGMEGNSSAGEIKYTRRNKNLNGLFIYLVVYTGFEKTFIRNSSCFLAA